MKNKHQKGKEKDKPKQQQRAGDHRRDFEAAAAAGEKGRSTLISRPPYKYTQLRRPTCRLLPAPAHSTPTPPPPPPSARSDAAPIPPRCVFPGDSSVFLSRDRFPAFLCWVDGSSSGRSLIDVAYCRVWIWIAGVSVPRFRF
jgi:hypothetical protein